MLVFVMGVIVGAGLLGAGNAVLSATGTEKFRTTSCHEMSHNNEEYKGTIHDANRTGVRATCVDCHTPKQGLPYYVRKLYAVQELWGHYVTHSIDTEEKLEAKRYELAVRVWTYMMKKRRLARMQGVSQHGQDRCGQEHRKGAGPACQGKSGEHGVYRLSFRNRAQRTRRGAGTAGIEYQAGIRGRRNSFDRLFRVASS